MRALDDGTPVILVEEGVWLSFEAQPAGCRSPTDASKLVGGVKGFKGGKIAT